MNSNVQPLHVVSCMKGTYDGKVHQANYGREAPRQWGCKYECSQHSPDEVPGVLGAYHCNARRRCPAFPACGRASCVSMRKQEKKAQAEARGGTWCRRARTGSALPRAKRSVRSVQTRSNVSSRTLEWFPPCHCCRSRLYSRYRPRGSQHRPHFPLSPFCLRLLISAQLPRRGPHCQTRIGRRFSGTACFFMKHREVGGCQIQTESLGGMIVA